MGLVTAYGISKTTHPKLLGFLLVFVSSHIINSKSPWLIRKDYTTMYWWPLCHIVSLLCFFTTQWVAYRVLFKSPCKVFFSLACYFSDDSIIGDFNSTAKNTRATSSAFPPDVLSPYTARKSTKVFLPRSQKSCSVLTQHGALSPQQLKCLKWQFYFFW